jgi:DNA-binding CsgD family transcriptional regulator
MRTPSRPARTRIGPTPVPAGTRAGIDPERPFGGAAIVRDMLLEREVELGTLVELHDQVGSTGGKVVLIRGEAGIGKSSLVDAFARAVRPHAPVYVGGSDDLAIPQAFGPFWDIARAEHSLDSALDAGDTTRLREAVLRLLSSAGGGAVVILEDTQWADEATLDAIRYLGRRIARTTGMLVLTYRDGEVDLDHPLRGVIGDIPTQDVVRIRLTGLSAEAVTSMLRDTSLDPADVVAATRGNPLLVREMAASADDGVPLSLHDAIAARMRRLTIGAQEALRTLSVIPEPITVSDACRLTGVDDARIAECEAHGLLDRERDRISFHHELIRRAIAASMTESQRVARYRLVLAELPEDTHPCLVIDCAVAVGDWERLIVSAPRSARYAVAANSHAQAVQDYRALLPYLDHVPKAELGPLLEEWADEESIDNEVAAAVRLVGQARDHYRSLGDRAAESRALAREARFQEYDGHRREAEELAQRAIDVLGPEPDGRSLARALETNAYLHTMAGHTSKVADLVDRTFRAGGESIEPEVRIRSLIHLGMAANTNDYPRGREILEEARRAAEEAGLHYEESRALLNNAWSSLEHQDIALGADYARRAVAVAVRHELPGIEASSRVQVAKALELRGAWDEALDEAHEVLVGPTIARIPALAVIALIEIRRGRPTATATLAEVWGLARLAGEFQRSAPPAIAVAEHAWTTDGVAPVVELRELMTDGLEQGFTWSPGRIACWLWELGDPTPPPDGIAEPYRLLIAGDTSAAAAAWLARGVPYERALALMHGDREQRLEALDVLETLGATAVAARLRRDLRGAGIAVPRGRGRATRGHPAGLTARQAEILRLLGEDLSNLQIADRLFISPRTVEHHVSAVLDKLDAASREDAVRLAAAEGLLRPDGDPDRSDATGMRLGIPA